MGVSISAVTVQLAEGRAARPRSFSSHGDRPYVTDLLSRQRSPRLAVASRRLRRSRSDDPLFHHVQVCGRAISVYHKPLSGWLEGRVTQFNPELSLHLVEYDCAEGQETAPEWLRLCSERPWQWLDERAPDAEPNPTSVGRVFDESVSALERCKLAVMADARSLASWQGGSSVICRLPSSACLLLVEAAGWVCGPGSPHGRQGSPRGRKQGARLL